MGGKYLKTRATARKTVKRLQLENEMNVIISEPKNYSSNKRNSRIQLKSRTPLTRRNGVVMMKKELVDEAHGSHALKTMKKHNPTWESHNLFQNHPIPNEITGDMSVKEALTKLLAFRRSSSHIEKPMATRFLTHSRKRVIKENCTYDFKPPRKTIHSCSLSEKSVVEEAKQLDIKAPLPYRIKQGKDPTFKEIMGILHDGKIFSHFLTYTGLEPKMIPNIMRTLHGLCKDLNFNKSRAHCGGNIYKTVCNGKIRFRCSKCRAARYAVNGELNPDMVRGSASFFLVGEENGERACIKLKREQIIEVLYYITYDIAGYIYSQLSSVPVCTSSIVFWKNIVKNITLKEFGLAFPLGGNGCAVYVDYIFESRRLRGNLKETTELDSVCKPRLKEFYILGIKDPISLETRLFYITQLDPATIFPLIEKHVANGSIIVTNSNKIYSNLSKLKNKHYVHRIVDRESEKFDHRISVILDSIQIFWESYSRKILTETTGKGEKDIEKYLSYAWWNSFNGFRVCSDPFMRLLSLISKHYPM